MPLMRPLLLLLILVPASCLAWNGRGHTAIARLAQANLSPAASARVAELLTDDLDQFNRTSGRQTLADVASWADQIRDVAAQTDPRAYQGWHIRANQVCSQKPGICRDGNCVDQLIIRFAGVLRDRKHPARVRNEALKWVVHLVGDLHMPLHSGINRNGGSAKVMLAGYTLKPDENFHTVWDKQLLDAALKGWQPQAGLEAGETLPADAPTGWMIETRELALREVYAPLPGFSCSTGRLPEPFELDAAYQQRAHAVIRLQVERAGLRLAQLLNETLAD